MSKWFSSITNFRPLQPPFHPSTPIPSWTPVLFRFSILPLFIPAFVHSYHRSFLPAFIRSIVRRSTVDHFTHGPFCCVQAPAGAYDDRLHVSRPVYSQETFDAVESARGANARDDRTATQKLGDKLTKFCHCDKKRATDFVFNLVPVLRWLPKYDLKTNLIGDIMAGFTISVLHLPQVGFFPIILFGRE